MPTVPGLQPFSGAALPLIATLLTLTIQTSTAELNPGAFEGEAAAAVSFLPESTVTVGQSLSEHAGTGGGENSHQEEPNKPKSPISLSRRNPRPGSRFSWGWTRLWTSSVVIPSTSSSVETTRAGQGTTTACPE